MTRALAAILFLVLAVSGCAQGSTDTSPSPAASAGPTALSSEQAERLAVVRFRNFDAGVRAFQLTVPGTEAGDVELTGWFDFTNNVGYGTIANGGTLWWSETTVAVREVLTDDAEFPLPTDQWISYPLDPESNSLATALTLIGNLGSDRPENPQLLAQTDALWLRSDSVDGTAVDVFVGPSSDDPSVSVPSDERARYWVDSSGTLLTFEALLGANWITLQLSDGTADIPTTTPGVQ